MQLAIDLFGLLAGFAILLILTIPTDNHLLLHDLGRHPNLKKLLREARWRKKMEGFRAGLWVYQDCLTHPRLLSQIVRNTGEQTFREQILQAILDRRRPKKERTILKEIGAQSGCLHPDDMVLLTALEGYS